MAFGLVIALFQVLPLLIDGRVVSVPDLHGDWDRTMLVLSDAGLMDPKTMSWTGGRDTLVQTGDITDRGSHTKKIYQLFQRLGQEAQAQGGAVINLMGNHEAMNLEGDLRYVVDGDYEEFGGRDQRAHAWSEQGWLGKWVRKFPVAATAGGVLFVHAGVLPRQFGGSDIGSLNDRVHSAISHMAQNSLAELGGVDVNTMDESSLLGDEGPLWTREYGNDDSDASCGDAREVLRRVGAVRMVVGHTPHEEQPNTFRVGSICGGQVLLGDTAISYAYGGEPSYVEHDGSGGAVAVYPRLEQKRHPLPDPPKETSSFLRRAPDGISEAL